MEKYSEEELNQLLADTGQLLKNMPLPESEYTLDDILAEYGAHGSRAASERGDSPASERPLWAGTGTEDPALVPFTEIKAEEPAVPYAETKAKEPAVPAAETKAEEPTTMPLAEVSPQKAAPIQEDVPETGHLVSVEAVMDRTVSAVLDEEAAARQEELEQERVAQEKARRAERRKARAAAAKRFVMNCAAALSAMRRRNTHETEIPEEPSMDMADFEEKRRCRRHRNATWRCLPMAFLLVGITAAETLLPLPKIWTGTPLLRLGTMGGLLLLEMLLALPLWKNTVHCVRQRRVGCGVGAFLLGLVCLGDCAWCALRGEALMPLCGAAGLVIFCCQWGLYLQAASRRETFHLASIGGTPPWGIRNTENGACKQAGRLHGFYTETMAEDLPQKWQQTVLPLCVCVATVLTGVVCLSGEMPEQPFWIWAALLAVSIPLAAPLCGALPLRVLSKRLTHSGCAVAGYCGAKEIGSFRQILVSDEDLFPAGTLSLNGLKIYGEEIRRVLAYTVSLAKLANSQALPMLEQMLSDEGGHTEQVDQFRWFEEGGVGGSIHGETVLLGSAYFMRKQKVRLPKELKVNTGLFLAVDGQLTAIFALRYQPSRNVDWALRALRRSRVTPVMAVRGCNVTPGLLQRSFKVNAKPIYPDVQTRLRLLELSRQTAPAHALLYRDGLLSFTEAVLGSRKLISAVRWTLLFATLAAVSGILLCYYLTGIGGFASLTPLRLVLFQLLWALPCVFLAGLIRFF